MMPAGPVAQRFSEAIEWIVAHDVVQLAKPRPWWIVIYTYRRDLDTRAQPYAMISKNEYGQPDDTYRVRIWDGDGFDHLEPMFPRALRVAEFLARYHPIKPNRNVGLGVSAVHTQFPLVVPVDKRTLRHAASACQWLRESHLFLDYASSFETYGQAARDITAMGEFVQVKEHWTELVELQIECLIRLLE